MPPSGFAAWDARDRTLALALTVLEDTTSPHGHDIASTLDPRSEGEFEVQTVIDQEQKALDEWHRQNEKPPPGTRPFVVWLGESVSSGSGQAISPDRE